MLVFNKKALFMEYGQEPEEYVQLGLKIVHEDGEWYIKDIQRVPVNAMIPEIQQKLRSLKDIGVAVITYSAEVNEDGYILYFIDVEIKLLKQQTA